MAKRVARVSAGDCVACGACGNVCPKGAVKVWKGCFARVDRERCIGCGKCAKVCPANALELLEREVSA